MAEVFRAESEGLQGFKKQVAIKRVLPHLSEKKKFISMFLDEARLSAQLSHSNCVQVFDIGVGDNAYFIVMEYVDGANLKAIAESLRKHGREFPVQPAALHRARDLQGAQLRARAPRSERGGPEDRPPRHVAAERARHEVRRDQDRGLRAREGELAARTERAGDHQGEVLLPVARGGDGAGGRRADGHLRRRDHPVGATRRAAALPRRDRFPDGEEGPAGRGAVDLVDQQGGPARSSRRSSPARSRGIPRCGTRRRASSAWT